MPFDRQCLGAQNGFAATDDGDLLAENEQSKQLALSVDVAGKAWK